MEIVVQLNPTAAARFRDESDTSTAVPELDALALSLEPMHPGESDPALHRYFTAELPDPEAAEQAVQTLRQSDAVEAAYVKPAAEPP